MMKTPPNASIEIVLSTISPGLAGLVECVAASMKSQGQDADVDELLCVSSAAFANYVYTPSVNGHETQEFSALGELFSNYGVFESLGYYTGWQIEDVNEVSDEDFWTLVKFEVLSGRPMVSVGFGGALGPVLVTGFTEETGSRVVHILADGESRTFDLMTDGRPQGDSEVFVNYAALVRPSESPEWAAGPQKQRMHALRWAATHASSGKEFFHETRENYLTGEMGVDALVTMAEEPRSDEFWSYIAEFARARSVSRRAAASVLPTWGRALAVELDNTEIEALLADAATAYAESADAFQAVDDSWLNALRDYAAAEKQAMEKLDQASALLPSPFG